MSVRPHPVHLILGLTIWAVFFVVVYGGMSVGCELSAARDSSTPFNVINGFVLAVTVVFTVPLAWLAWQCHKATPAAPHNRRFLARMSTILYAVSALATFLVGLPGVIYPPCL